MEHDRSWPKAEVSAVAAWVRFGGNSGQDVLAVSLSAYDPEQTSDTHYNRRSLQPSQFFLPFRSACYLTLKP